MVLLSRAFAEAGRSPDALSTLAEADEWARATGQYWVQAEQHRLRGNVLLRACPADAPGAVAAFQEALFVAREQSARMCELRAARDLAQLWVAQGAHRKAYDLLAPIYGWFTEGFDLAELKQAKTLLDSLT